MQTEGSQPVVEKRPLSELHFDPENPRFGDDRPNSSDESVILDHIVDRYGVHDVISSISQNGYLPNEPLVGIESNFGVKIIEGNRRLAALLILSGDPRGKNQSRLRSSYPVTAEIGDQIKEVPVIAYPTNEQPDRLLPYMGVRHIVGPTEWDSYAKSAWVARVLESGQGSLSLADIERMIGDRRGTMRRMLEGYYLMKQLEANGNYRPEWSLKRGRGSNPHYPFSWVYNILGWTDAREFAGLSDREPKKDPVARAKLSQAAELVSFMFGNKSADKQPAISDSREFGDLATCVSSPERLIRLRRGRAVSEVMRDVRPAADRFVDSLGNADESLDDAWTAAGELTSAEAEQLAPRARITRDKAKRVHDHLIDLQKRED